MSNKDMRHVIWGSTIRNQVLFILCVFTLIFYGSCQQTPQSNTPTIAGQSLAPFSDPSNEEGWVLNELVSDEFEGSELDTGKWFIQGLDDRYYIWKGRAPAQFAAHNVRLEDGKLKLRTQWEPGFNFANMEYAGAWYGKYEGNPMPVTTAGVITKNRFLNGYMEVKSKAGDACITAAFWAIGYEQELDVFEQMGKPKINEGSIQENSVRTAVHDWSPPAVRPTRAFGYDEKNLPYRTADEFHVYGAEWGTDYLKVYRDGQLTYQITQDELGTDWVLNNPMEIWLDSEIFRWLGMPDSNELPVDFEIEYLRVWQKPDDNLFDRAFFGFEGPILFEENPRPLNLVPESSVPDEYQKFWLIDSTSRKYLDITEGDYASGVNSLKFSGFGKNEKLEADRLVALSPPGAIEVPAGQYEISLKVWMDQGRSVNQIFLSFEHPRQEIPIDLSEVPKREWTTLSHKIQKAEHSTAQDQFKIEIRKEDVPVIKAAKLFIDDISLRPISPQQ